MKLCRDCRHFRAVPQDCLRPENMRASVIDGKERPNNSIEWLRRGYLDTEQCGQEGNWWEPKS